MDLSNFGGNIENWFLARTKEEFPDNMDYVSIYNSILIPLKKIHKQVTEGADESDGTSLTWHDESHINKVIKQASKLLSYSSCIIKPYEVFVLLVAIQIHDIKNIEGRAGHENRAIDIFNDLKIPGVIDSILLKNIGFVASCHAGSLMLGGKKTKDKIYLLNPTLFGGEKKIHLRFLAALLRLADEFADDSERAMSFLLEIGKIKKGSIIHQKHAECLIDVHIEANTGKVDFDYHVKVNDAIKKFPKYIAEKDTYEDVYLLDEIFDRTVKSHYETVYCMRYLRPYISINKINISVEVEGLGLANQLRISYEMEEVGYPNDELNIIGLCGEKYLKYNGIDYWSGENLKEYLDKPKN